MKSAALTLAAALLAAQPAMAADRHAWRVGPDSIHLYYSDLDVNTLAGRAEVLARVEQAARRLCEARLKVEEDECVSATLRDAARLPAGRDLAVALAEHAGQRVARR